VEDRKIDIVLSNEALSPENCRAQVLNPRGGAIVEFIGTVRNSTSNKQVMALHFEAYAPMAEKEMRKIAIALFEHFDILAVSIHHRIGALEIGDIPVIIAVCSPHRKAAFLACEKAIDTLKETVPIWKKEIFEDGEIWVAAHP
jgi:molybdopterin synthase catalytic subunit